MPSSSLIKAYEDLIEAKKMDYCDKIGLSNFKESQIVPILIKFPSDPIYMNQIEMSLVCQNNNLCEYCKKNGIVVQSHSLFSKRGIETEAIEKEYKKEFNELVIGWLKFKSINFVFGSSNIDHIKKNIKVEQIEIKNSDLDKINIVKLSY